MVSMQKMLIAAVCASAFSSAAYADDCTFRYSTQIANRAAKIDASVSAQALRAISSDLASAIGENKPSAEIGYEYSISAAGGAAREAYSETIVNGYLCSLREKFKTDPAKLQAIDDAEIALTQALDDYYMYDVWMGSESGAKRDAIKAQIRNSSAATGPLSLADAEAGLPKKDFDTVTLRNRVLNVTVPGVTTVDGCYGVVESSIRKVEPSTLSSLGLIRPMLIKYMSGNQKLALNQIWMFVSGSMNQQMMTANQKTSVPATPETLACVNKAKVAAESQEQKLVAQDPPA